MIEVAEGEVVALNNGKGYRAEASKGCEGCAFAPDICAPEEEAKQWDLCRQVTCADIIFIELPTEGEAE
jgi:hypothetical protein